MSGLDWEAVSVTLQHSTTPKRDTSCESTHSMQTRSATSFLGIPLVIIAGTLVLFGLISWVLWRESIATEEQRVAELARVLGERTEQIIVDARDMLDTFNNSSMPRCSVGHSQSMHEAAIAKPYIRAIGYWRTIIFD